MSHRTRPPTQLPKPRHQPIWAGCLPEKPHCAVPGCEHPAHAVDPFFPYLDDRNRCFEHAPEIDSPYVAQPAPMPFGKRCTRRPSTQLN